MAVMYKMFEVDPKYVSGGKYIFTPTSNGEMLIASFKGKKYFVKRDSHLRYPAPGDSPAGKEKKLKDVKPRERKQEKLKNLMKGLDSFKDRIVVEEYHFTPDDDLQFATVSALIPDVFPDSHKFSSLDAAQFRTLSLEMAKNLVTLHERGIIHGDLKEKNILVKKLGYIPYLIDFDTSFPANEVPEANDDGEPICGTPGYQSPELVVYGKIDDPPPITTATDIFSLGVVMHRWWTDSFPSLDYEKPFIGEAVFLDKKVYINKKFNVPIGPDCEVSYSSLLNWMFAKDPAKRPTAKEAAAVLSDEMDVPDEYQAGDDKDRFMELWPTHVSVAELINVMELKKKVKSFKRINDGSGSGGLKYLVKLKGGLKSKDGNEEILSIDEICEKGYAVRKRAVIDEPWDEHFIEFEPEEVITKKGYIKIERVELSYKKRYLITFIDGRYIDKSHDWLVSEGLARPKTANIDSGVPWPEDGTAYNPENWVKLNIKKIECVDIGGEHGYVITYNDDSKPSKPVRAKNLALMGLFVK